MIVCAAGSVLIIRLLLLGLLLRLSRLPDHTLTFFVFSHELSIAIDEILIPTFDQLIG